MGKISKEHIVNMMNLYNREFIQGLRCYIEAHGFILRHGFWKYMFISGFIFLLFFSVVMKALIHGIDVLEPIATDWIISVYKSLLNVSEQSVKTGIEWSFWLLKTMVSGNQDKIFTTIFLIIGVPYFSYVTSRASAILFGRKQETSNFNATFIRGLKLSVIITLKQVGLFLLITLISFIPVIGILSPLLMFIVQAYYNGIFMMDFTLELHGLNITESRLYYQQNKSILFTLGLVFMFLLPVPVIGWFVSPTYALITALFIFRIEKPAVIEK